MSQILPKKTCTQLADGARLCETRQLSGDRGIYQTMYLMRDLARRDARDERIIGIARKLKGDTDLLTAYNVFEWMVKNYPYQSDPDDHEFVSAPVHTITEAHNDKYPHRDCDDLAAAYASLLKAAGVRTQYLKAIAWRKNDYTHVYNLIYCPSIESYIPVDLVMQKQGFGREKQPQIRAMHIRI